MLVLWLQFLTEIAPQLLRSGQLTECWAFAWLFLLGPLTADRQDQPWEQPYIYANF